MKRLVILLPVILALQVGVEPALAWTWPVDGPVLRPFELGSDPYAAGQHRGIDIGAPAGTPVRAPASGSVSFAGTVPVGGLTVTISTADGYSVTLVHLGGLGVARGADVGEGALVGTVGPSGVAEGPDPYVHLGVRLTADPNGYLDPLTFLPARAAPPADPEPVAEPAPSVASGEDEPAQGAAEPGSGTTAPVAEPKPAAGRDRASSAARRRHHVPEPVVVPRPAWLARASDTRAGTANRAPRATWEAELLQPPKRTEVLRSFEPLGRGAAHDPIRARAGGGPPVQGLLLACLALAVAATGLALRRKLGDARAADVTPAMLCQRARPTAEDACAVRLGEKDRLVLDRDLERILLAEPEALPDLDRNDDAAELVDVSNDARPRHAPSWGAGRRSHCLARTARIRPRQSTAGVHA
jgi:hypothetical protein